MDYLQRQELEDEHNARYGDPRRCPEHGCVTSSPDGMHDCPCWECEGEMEDDYREECEREFANEHKFDDDTDWDLPF